MGAPSSLIPYCLLIIAALLLCGAAPLAHAQQNNRIAVVDTRAFAADILEYKQQVDQINRKFDAPTREVQKLATDLRNFEVDLNTNRLNYTEQIRRQRTEQLEQMRRQYNRKSEDLQAQIKREAEQSINPIRDKIMKSLEGFATERGISLLFDIGTAAERGGILYVSPGIDITAEFVNYYNKARPK